MADNVQATKQILYSWDEGLSWETFTFTDKPMYVQNIVIQPDNMDNLFFILGSVKKNNKN